MFSSFLDKTTSLKFYACCADTFFFSNFGIGLPDMNFNSINPNKLFDALFCPTFGTVIMDGPVK